MMLSDNCRMEKIVRIFSRIPSAAAVVDSISRELLYANEAFFNLVGYTPEEYGEQIGDDYRQLFFPADMDTALQNKVTFARNEAIRESEYRIVRQDGSIRSVKLTAEQLYIEGKDCAVCFFEDITSDKEHLLQLKLVTESIGGSISLLRIVGSKEELIYANDLFFKLLGMSQDEYKRDIHYTNMSLLSADDRQLTADTVTKSLVTGKPQELEYRLLRPGKDPLWMSRRLFAMKQDEEGTILMASVATDISERKNSELERVLEHSRYQLVIDDMKAAVFEWNMDTGMFYCSEKYNDYAMSTVSPDVLLANKGPMDIIHPDDRDKVLQFFKDTENRTLRAHTTIRMKLISGGYCWCRLTGLFYRDENGKLSRTLGIITDVSDEKEKSLMLDSFTSAFPGGIAVLRMSEDAHPEYYSDSFAGLFDTTREKLDKMTARGSFFQTFVYPPDLRFLLGEIAEKKKTGAHIDVTCRYLAEKGVVKRLRMTADKIREEDGYPVYYCLFTSPDGENPLYRSIVEDSVTGISVARRDNGLVLFDNAAMRRFKQALRPEPDLEAPSDAADSSDDFLGGEAIDSLSYDEFLELHVLKNGKYLGVRAKALDWDGIGAYICYVTDETSEYQKNLKRQELLNLVPAGIGVYELSYGEVKQLYINGGYFRMIGETREHYEKTYDGQFWTLVHPDDAPPVSNLINKLISGSQCGYTDLRIKCGDGKYRWFRLNASVVQRRGDKITAYCSYSDYNETVETQESLKKANKMLKIQYEQEFEQRKILEKDSIVSIQFDITQDKLLKFSTTSNTIQIYENGLTSATIHESLLSRIPVEKERNAAKEFYSIEKNLEMFYRGISNHTVEYRSRQRNGCLRWLRAVCHLKTDEQTGDIISYTFIRDIDVEKKQALAAESVIDEETDYLTVLSVVTGKALLLKLKSGYKYPGWKLNEEFDFKLFTDSEHLGLVYPDDTGDVVRFFDKDALIERLKHEKLAAAAYRLTSCDGTVRRKKTRAYYLDETHEDIVVTRRDITDLYEEEQAQKRRLQSALNKADSASRAKTIFLSNMSHEIRTPLNAVIGLTELALGETKEPGIRESLESIKSSSDYLLGILNDILDMSRIENGKLNLDRQWASPDKVLAPCVEMIRPAMEAKNITFTISTFEYPQPFEFYVDVSKTQRMLMNLLNNACKFTGKGGHIKLSTQNKSHGCGDAVDLIIIEDDGCGMSEDFLTRIFTPFSQERNIYTDSTQGTGLGLSLARQTALAMGGDITVESKLGSGSKFTISIPYKYRIAENHPEATETQRPDGKSKLDGVRVLLCEDNRLNTMISKKLLEKEGCVVECAENGKIGLEKFSASKPGYYDVVLMDIRMPELDGLEAAKAIRALDRPDAASVPIIAMSANAFEEDLRTSLSVGMNDHLAKPVEPEKLYDAIVLALGKQ